MPLIAIGLILGVVAAVLSIRKRSQLERRLVCAHVQPEKSWRVAHEQKVARVAEFLRRRTHHAPLVLRKRVASHQVPKAGDLKYSDEALDIRDLNRILDIDPLSRTCEAEPGVTFVDLVSATLKHGLVPIVVPEFKTITLGGAVAGCSVESMSFKHGGFHDGCLEYEVITSSGEVLICTPENENRLVFQMIHGTFGTLGVVSKLKFKLVPAKPFVRVEYEQYRTLADYKAATWRHYQTRDVDFMDGIIHSPTRWVLCVGRFVNQAPYISRYDWTKVYYQSTGTRSEDWLRTEDYFFRYDRGVTNVHPKSVIGRFFLGKFLGSSQVLTAAARLHWLLGSLKPTITLDLFLPFSRLEAFFDWYRGEFDFFPLWFVPYRRVRDYEWVSNGFYARIEDELFVDVAIYGMNARAGKNDHKIMEDKLLEFSGIKTLISQNYYSEQDFWKTWNKPNYDAVKAKTDPNNIFRNLYSKTCRATHGLEDHPPSSH